MAHNTRGAGVSQEDYIRPGGLPAGVPEGWGGAVQAAGEAAPGHHRQGKQPVGVICLPYSALRGLMYYHRPHSVVLWGRQLEMEEVPSPYTQGALTLGVIVRQQTHSNLWCHRRVSVYGVCVCVYRHESLYMSIHRVLHLGHWPPLIYCLTHSI